MVREAGAWPATGAQCRSWMARDGRCAWRLATGSMRPQPSPRGRPMQWLDPHGTEAVCIHGPPEHSRSGSSSPTGPASHISRPISIPGAGGHRALLTVGARRSPIQEKPVLMQTQTPGEFGPVCAPAAALGQARVPLATVLWWLGESRMRPTCGKWR